MNEELIKKIADFTMMDNFEVSLILGALGMLGIFIFMLFFWGLIVLLVKIFPAKEEE